MSLSLSLSLPPCLPPFPSVSHTHIRVHSRCVCARVCVCVCVCVCFSKGVQWCLACRLLDVSADDLLLLALKAEIPFSLLVLFHMCARARMCEV